MLLTWIEMARHHPFKKAMKFLSIASLASLVVAGATGFAGAPKVNVSQVQDYMKTLYGVIPPSVAAYNPLGPKKSAKQATGAKGGSDEDPCCQQVIFTGMPWGWGPQGHGPSPGTPGTQAVVIPSPVQPASRGNPAATPVAYLVPAKAASKPAPQVSFAGSPQALSPSEAVTSSTVVPVQSLLALPVQKPSNNN